MEPRLRTSPEQFAIIIDFMERHGDLSRPQSGPQGRLKSDQQWQQLTDSLNSLGGGVKKSPDKWKKVWADWKTKTKKKYLNLRLQASRTGGGPSTGMVLTALEERVVVVIGVSAVVGQTGVQEQGFHPESAMDLPLEHALHIEVEGHNSQNIAILTHSSPAFPQPEEDTPALSPSVPPQVPPVPSTSQTPHLPPAPPPSLPPQAPLPPLPRTPVRNSRRQASGSPSSSATTPRQALLRARRNRAVTPFERAANEFANIERRRLEYEELRDNRLHEREVERLRLDAERIDVARFQNNLLNQLSLIGQQLIDILRQQRPSS